MAENSNERGGRVIITENDASEEYISIGDVTGHGVTSERIDLVGDRGGRTGNKSEC